MIEIDRNFTNRIQQGDILRDIDFIQRIDIKGNDVSIYKITFPLIIVLTQDCDLKQDAQYHFESDNSPSTDDKKLLSAIVAPIYNEEMFLLGEHLKDDTINYTMQKINKKKKGKFTTQYTNLINNEISRYHHLKFKENDPIVDSVIDFKHYFTVNIEELVSIKKDRFICKIKELYREDISIRFANFLSRIGLPNTGENV
jgi:hypothetical protein